MSTKVIFMYIGGIVFGLGLAVSGAARPEITLSFLQLKDLGLLLVIGGALVIALITYQLVPRLLRKPLFSDSFGKKEKLPVDRRTIIGAVIFGIGWGVSGLCPGTAIVAIGMGNVPVIAGIIGIFLGTLVYGFWRSHFDNSKLSS